jgi:prepilin-type N-terminal cleavage/methylation domain-containing protein
MRIRLKRKQSSEGHTAQARAALPESGYTLAEVLVAAAIMGVMATALYGAFAAGFCVIQSTRENLRATQIMMQKMEAVRLFTWSQICDTNNYLKPFFVEPYDPLGVTNNCGGAEYTGYISAAVPATGDLPEAYRTNMRTVTVTVYWTNLNGGKPLVHTREIQTRVARNGMQNYIWGAL